MALLNSVLEMRKLIPRSMVILLKLTELAHQGKAGASEGGESRVPSRAVSRFTAQTLGCLFLGTVDNAIV